MGENRLTITVEEAGRLLGISRGLAYQMAREGRIPTIRFGKRLVVPKWAIEHLLQEPREPAVSQQLKS
jgi:excisionase family DNA binding protein